MGPPFFDGGNIPTHERLHQRAKPLQWGRRFLTAETLTAWRKPIRQRTASMGPPFFDGGNVPDLRKHNPNNIGFNGAAVF